MTITSKIRAVGNSKGVILPKKYLDQCGIEDLVDITIKDRIITIQAKNEIIKKNWVDFKPLRKKTRSTFVSNKFDEVDWTW
jgi:antitoxin component of MazEF toxin-antitoxin module